MHKPTFHIVDVFAEEKYAGNQLAVFRNVTALSDLEMQNIAREMHFSETTFVMSEKESTGGYEVRIFTPAEEIPFAGHPTLGTAFVIQQEILKRPVETVRLNLKVGQIPVTFRYADGKSDILWMKQKSPAFGAIFTSRQVLPILRVNKDDIDEKFPIQEVSTGMPFIIVPLKTLDVLKRARIDRDLYFELIKNTEAKAILIFCPQTYNRGNHLSVRMFADYYGVPEDPATGSANGCLAGYLAKHRYWGSGLIDIRVDQGYEIKRPSLLLLKSEDGGEEIEVMVGGKVIMVAKGELV